jgi:diaminopimelate decarboxylase
VAGADTLEQIAAAAGTPAYVYSADAIRAAYHQLDRAFGDAPHAIHYAMKANSALAIVRLVRSLGSAADANSIGEVEVALKCGFAPSEIVFTGVGKRRDELERAVALNLLAINVESPGELDRLARIAADRGAVARVASREPDIDARSHPHISMASSRTSSGCPTTWRPRCSRRAARPSLRAVGIMSTSARGSPRSIRWSARRNPSRGWRASSAMRARHRALDFGGGLASPTKAVPRRIRPTMCRILKAAGSG